MYYSLRLISTFVLGIYVRLSLECAPCAIHPLLTRKMGYPLCDEYGKREGNQRTCSIRAGPCNPFYKYRSLDGSCNNLKFPTMGMEGAVFTRMLPSCYQDHRHSLALGLTGQRPLARVLSTGFFPDQNYSDVVTLAVMQWGQIVAHDISLSIVGDTNLVDCCTEPWENLAHYENTCLPIKIPKNDYFFSQYKITCINMLRTNVTWTGNCSKAQPAQQTNTVTHVLDASLVYGSSLAISNQLREFVGGRLQTQRLKDGKVFLPNLSPDEVETVCFVKNVTDPCYMAGDSRVNQNTELTVLQIALLREHNRIADELQVLHPYWDDETIYQETRTIIIAQVQHITYGEWMEHFIGKDSMIHNGLYPKKYGYTKYSGDIDFTIINSFATAAYRVGHSGIQGFLSMLNYHGDLLKAIPVSKWMNRPLIIEQNNNFDELLLGLTNQHMQMFDRYYTHQITNLLFRGFKSFGQDLVSFDIERGRDHALAPYIYYLEMCTGYKITKFEDLEPFIFIQWIYKLKQYYKSVGDIDLTVGARLEHNVPNSRLGPTFLCIVTEQFYRTKWGDRFWYEVGGQPHSFTKDQLHELRKASLSRLLCNSGDHITHIAVNSFLPPSPHNRIVPCDKIPAINLSQW